MVNRKRLLVVSILLLATALANAASIAGLMLTTEALVTTFDAKDEDKKAVVGSIR